MGLLRGITRNLQGAVKQVTRTATTQATRATQAVKTAGAAASSSFSKAAQGATRTFSNASRGVTGTFSQASRQLTTTAQGASKALRGTYSSVSRQAANTAQQTASRFGTSLRATAHQASKGFNHVITQSYRDAKELKASSDPLQRAVGTYSVAVRDGVAGLNRTVDNSIQYWKGVRGPVGRVMGGLASLGQGFTAPLRAVDHTATNQQRNAAVGETALSLVTGGAGKVLGKVGGPVMRGLAKSPLGQAATRGATHVVNTPLGRQMARLPQVASWLNQAPARALHSSALGRKVLTGETALRNGLSAANHLGRAPSTARLSAPGAQALQANRSPVAATGDRKLIPVLSELQKSRPPRVQVSPVPTIADRVSPTRLVAAPPGNPKWYGVRNNSGGTVWISRDPVDKHEVAKLAKDLRSDGTVRVLTGTHGTEMGGLKREVQFYKEDIATMKADPRNGMGARDINEMSEEAMKRYINSNRNVVLGWCYAERNTQLPGWLNAGQPK